MTATLQATLDDAALTRYVSRQLSHFFPDRDVTPGELAHLMPEVLGRVEHCFSRIRNKYFFDGTQVYFNHLHSDQYATFLYYLSNTIWRREANRELAGKVYYLNKALHGLEVYFEIELPAVFLLSHPVGTVLGRATYGSYLVLYQGCTVGGNAQLEYPVIGEGVAFFSHSAAIGRSNIADGCLLAAGALLIDTAVPGGMVVYGRYPDVGFKATSKSVRERYFRDGS